MRCERCGRRDCYQGRDRLLAHNPIGALTSGYGRKRLGLTGPKGSIRRRK